MALRDPRHRAPERSHKGRQLLVRVAPGLRCRRRRAASEGRGRPRVHVHPDLVRGGVAVMLAACAANGPGDNVVPSSKSQGTGATSTRTADGGGGGGSGDTPLGGGDDGTSGGGGGGGVGGGGGGGTGAAVTTAGAANRHKATTAETTRPPAPRPAIAFPPNRTSPRPVRSRRRAGTSRRCRAPSSGPRSWARTGASIR